MSILKYDSDCTTWNPQGQILQINYAEEAVKQGSICLALKSEKSCVLLSVKKNPTKWACYQEKIFQISSNIGIGISGMTADARVLCKYMRKQNTKSRIKYGFNISVNNLASKVSKKYRAKTYISGRRPFGVGILLAGFDNQKNPRIFELSPSGECSEYEAWAIGAKSQSSKTYMENNQKYLKGSNDEYLILHGLSSIKTGYRDEKEEMTEKNIEVSLINEHGFRTLSEQEIKHYIQGLENFNPQNQMQIE